MVLPLPRPCRLQAPLSRKPQQGVLRHPHGLERLEPARALATLPRALGRGTTSLRGANVRRRQVVAKAIDGNSRKQVGDLRRDLKVRKFHESPVHLAGGGEESAAV